jgi:hypothetical protein
MQLQNTVVQYQGSFIGTAAQHIEKLLEMLAEQPLDPAFEDRGNFIYEVEPANFGAQSKIFGEYWDGGFHIYGDFYQIPWAFSVYTKDPDVAQRLTTAIEQNKATAAYEAIREHETLWNDFRMSFAPGETA